MRKLVFFSVIAICLSGCVSASKSVMQGVSEKHKTACLEYTKIGRTSEFKLKGIATGTYKSLGHEAGLIYHAGSQNIGLTVNARQQWRITAESKRQSFKAPGLFISLHNPYVGIVKKGDKPIGTIGISMPDVDKATEALKYVGLDNVMARNLHLTGQANIFGRKYQIESVYADDKWQKQSSPRGYRVIANKKTVGLIQVGKNMTGGHVLQVWIAPGLSPMVEQSVVATLLVCGYAV